ncbi:unnamed protein product [Lampetra planeri]
MAAKSLNGAASSRETSAVTSQGAGCGVAFPCILLPGRSPSIAACHRSWSLRRSRGRPHLVAVAHKRAVPSALSARH